MAAGIAQRFDQEVGGTVDHLRLRREIGGRVHETGQLDHAHQLFDVATTSRFDLSQAG